MITTNDQRSNVPDVVVVGFGFAGAHAVSALVDAGRSVVVVEPTGAHQFLTRLAAVAGGVLPLRDAAVRIEDMFDVSVIRERALSASDGQVMLESGEVLATEYVLLTAGAEPVSPPIDGLNHAIPLRTVRDAAAIRRRVGESEHVVVIGGGPTGCQLAGAISAHQPDVRVTIVDGGDQLMSAFHPKLGLHACDVLSGRGVEIVLGDEVESIADGYVTLHSGVILDGSALWAAGYQASMSAFGPTDDGRLIIDDEGRVEGCSTVFSAGDAAFHTNEHGEAFPMSAQIAAQAGKQIGRNLSTLIDGGPSASLELDDRGWIVDLSGGVGVAEVLGVPIAQPGLDRVVPLLHEAVDLRNLWQLGGLDFVRRFRSHTSRPSTGGDVGDQAFELDVVG